LQAIESKDEELLISNIEGVESILKRFYEHIRYQLKEAKENVGTVTEEQIKYADEQLLFFSQVRKEWLEAKGYSSKNNHEN